MKHILILLFMTLNVSAICNAKMSVERLVVEHECEPMAVCSMHPRFSWQMSSDGYNIIQKAYSIVVCNESGMVVWDSGRIASDRSVDIVYGGRPLQPETRYTWTVSVWDSRGNRSSSSSFFETAVADWGGARWIGGGDIPFYCQYLPVFRIGFSVSLSGGKDGRVGFLYGANDTRLMSNNRNILGMAAERGTSYIEVQLASDSLRLYRVGYKPSDKAGLPLKSFAMPSGFDINRFHDVLIHSAAGHTRIDIDGHEIGHVGINPMGNGGDYIAFPVVGDVGYRLPQGCEATFRNVRIENYRSPNNILCTMDFGTVSGMRLVSPHETGALMLRRDFTVEKGVRKARLYVTARGIYDFSLNGKRVGDGFFAPGLTQYNKTHFYQTYDVTSLLREGNNVAGAVLNEGWWSGGFSFDPACWNWFGDRQSLLACLRIWYDDGSCRTVVTSPGEWQSSNSGPIRCGSLFQGEVYDARVGYDGFGLEGYDAASWAPAKEVCLEGTVSDKPVGDWPLADDYSRFELVPQLGGQVKCFEELTAQAVTEPRPGVFVYDMGQNFAGVPRIVFRGLRRGQKVVMRFAEVLYPDLPAYARNAGMPMLENIRAAMAQDIYISRGDSVEEYIPRSTYHGYRYVELTGIGSPLPVDDVHGMVLSSVDGFTAGYHSSDTLLNRLVTNVRYSTLSNVFSVPTDCPQRNERMGWSGDVSVFVPAMSFLWDADRFVERHVRALRDTQEPDGAFPPIAPGGGGFGGPLWQSAGIVLPWNNYLRYGDTVTVREHYPAMKRYIDMVMERYIDKGDGHFRGSSTWKDLGDWLGPQNRQNDNTLLFDSYLVYELGLMEKMAALLGLDDDARRYAKWRKMRREFINNNYLDSLTSRTVGTGHAGKRVSTWTGYIGSVGRGRPIDTHTSYAVPLALGVIDTVCRQTFADNLARLVVSPSYDDAGKKYPPYSLMTGFVGTPWICYSLSDNGHAAEAYRLLMHTGYPSWLYPVTQGATTIWERLNSFTHEDGFGRNNSMNSFNHYAFGCVFDWLMQRSAGISPDEASPAFHHFFLRPVTDSTGRLTSAAAHYDSMYGRIESGWRIEPDGTTVYKFTVPANTKATLMLPISADDRIKPDARALSGHRNGDIMEYELGSGKYVFEIKKRK